MTSVFNSSAPLQFLDTFYDNGGNFIDTANNYQDGEVSRSARSGSDRCADALALTEREACWFVDEG